MKFAEHLGSHLTPEWRTQYVQYDEMKVFLYDATENAPISDEVNDEILRRHFAKFDDDFFSFCDSELNKVNAFFAEKLAEAIRRFNELEMEVANTGVQRLQSVVRKSTLNADDEDGLGLSNDRGVAQLPLQGKKRPSNKKKLNNMKFIVGEFYLSLMLIQNFQQLNFTAFRKILKKHDKIFKTTTGVEYRTGKVEVAPFYLNKDIDEIITNTETIAIEDLEGGDRAKAMKRLRVPPLAEKQKTMPAFFWGLFTGMWLILLIVMVVLAYTKRTHVSFKCSNSNKNTYSNNSIVNSSSSNITSSESSITNAISLHRPWEPALLLYRGFLIIFIMISLLGVNIHGWRQAGVNHVLIFELDPRHHLSSIEVLMIASLFGVFWSISALVFLLGNEVMLVYAQPIALGSFLLLFFLNPTRTFWYRSRRWLLKILFRILCAPFFPVKFADFWLADQLNSLVVAIRDFEYLICFYAYELYQEEKSCICSNPKTNYMRPVVALLPAWFRFAQCLRRYYDTRKCFPHLVNAGKYFTSIMVTVLSTIASITETKGDFKGPFTITWILCLIISTIYSLTWDLRMDWGLFSKNAGENVLLREQIVYNYKAYYYLAIVSDVFLRFLKPLTVSIGTSGFINHELFILLLGTCEVVRRFIWNFFRLENEHLNNAGEFRAVRDINIKPIECFHEPIGNGDGKEKHTIEQVMDSDTGPLPKRRVVQMLLNSNEDTITRKDSSGMSLQRKVKKQRNRGLSGIIII